MGVLSEWRNKSSWLPLPSDQCELDVENKLLYQDNIETSSRPTSNASEHIRLLSRRNGFGINKGWLILTMVNTLLLCISIILNKDIFWDFTRHCIKETSAYCQSPLKSNLARTWTQADFQSSNHRIVSITSIS